MTGLPHDPQPAIDTPGGVDVRPAQTLAENARLQKERFYLASIVEFASDAIVSIDLDGRVTSWNKTAEQLLGYGAAEIIGQPAKLLFPPDRLDEERELFARVRQGDCIRSYETWRLRKDGSLVPVSVTTSPIRDDAGKIVGVSKFLHDMTEKKHILDELKTLQAETIHLSRWNMMGAVAGSLAHELNQPLMATMNFIQASCNLLPNPMNNARVTGLLEKALKEVDLASGIVRSLRSFIDKRESPRTLEKLNTVLEDGLSLLTVVMVAKEKLVRKFAGRLPPVMMDRVQIQQVLINLVRNAAEAMRDMPGGRIVVETKLGKPGFVLVSVSDNGPGLSQDVLNQPFQAFVTTKKNGMGLGLSICRTIIEAHGGRIWAEPNRPSGVTFYFQLPVPQESAGR